MKRSMWFGLVLATLLAPAGALAQRPLQQVLDLNRQAMEAYNNLEIEQARDKLEQAIEVARRGNVRGSPLARTFLNMGVIYVGGFADNARGLEFFGRALQVDPNIQLDPLTSTPDISQVFALARQRAGGGGGGGGGREPPDNGGGGGREPPDNGGGGGREPPDNGGGGGGGGAGNVPHQPVPEQLSQTPVPVYVELQAAQVYLYYKGLGMREFRRVEMRRLGQGWGFEIPCADVYEPKVEYYIVGFGEDGSPAGFAGTPQEPVEVPIVSERTQPPPALPGSAPPQQCGEQECPPGMPGCHGGGGGSAGLGDTCTNTGDCRSGLTCEDNFCIAGEGDGGGGSSEPGVAPRFFIHFGGTIGFAYVSAGMPADGPDPQGVETGSGAEDTNAWVNCEDLGSGFEDSNCEVRIKTPGFVPTVAVRAVLGYYITERIALALGVRFQPSSGLGNLANLLIGLRGQYLITDPVGEGMYATIHAGTSYGQIQPQPPQNGEEGPFAISGLNGIQLGSTIGYRFARNVGVFATPEINVLLPTFLLDIDLNAGLELAF